MVIRSMIDRLRYRGPPAGLGTILIQLSFILATKKPIDLVVDRTDNLALDIKRIWQISDDRLIVTVNQDIDAMDWLDSDELCTYAPYLYSETIRLYNKEFQVGRKNKSCVALCMHHGSGLGEDLELKAMPFNKYATMSEYQEIWQRLCRLGYDVIVINRPDINIEQKTYLLNELCEFVIGYEGGLHHLAHCLKIPCIVLPWRYNDMGHAPSYPGIYYETHRFHPDRKTHFLDKIDEFLNMTNEQIYQLIEDLHNDRGNNILFSPDVKFDPETLKITHRSLGMDLTPRICWCETRGERTVKLIRENLPQECMVRYPVD